MKNQKVCPKCSGSDILIIDGEVRGYGTGNNIMLGASIFSVVEVDRYICCSCGYTEEWVNMRDVEAIRKSKRAHRCVKGDFLCLRY